MSEMPDLPDVAYEMTIPMLGNDEYERCPIVRSSWGFARCTAEVESTVEMICKTCGRMSVSMCNGCVAWVIDYVTENNMGCRDQTPGQAIVAVESVEVNPC